MCRQASRKTEDNFSATLLSAGIHGHTGSLIPLSNPQGLVVNPRCFLMTMMMTEQRCLPSSHVHVQTHTHLPLPLRGPLPKVPSFLSSRAIQPTFRGHLSLVWLPPPTLAPAWQLPAPAALRRPGPRAWGRARVEQVDAVLLEVEQERGGVTGAGGVPGSLHPCLQRGVKE